MKACSILTRRIGMTSEAFRTYYEDIHAPLACRFHPFQKYMRNHLIDTYGQIDFDVIMEAWFDDDSNLNPAISPEARALLDIDMRNFMQLEMIRAARVQESILWGERPTPVSQSIYRQMALLKADFSNPRTLEDVVRWGKKLGAEQRAECVSIDVAQTGLGDRGAFPCQAILSLWFDRASAPRFSDVPSPLRLDAWILAEVCETDLRVQSGN